MAEFNEEAMNRLETIRTRLISDLSRDPGILILAYPYARTWKQLGNTRVKDCWTNVTPGDSAAIYVHIPFCRRKCKFCDFLAYYGRSEDEIARYLELLSSEINLTSAIASYVNVSTVHLGGGTPSLLSPQQVYSLIQDIRSNFRIESDTQVTLEVFPDEYVTKEHLAAWESAGVTRLSFGFQFFDNQLKRNLNRSDLAADNLRLFRDAKAVGYDDVNIDLMCGLPEQSPTSWSGTVLQTIALNPTHVCVFPVSVRHPGIPLFKKQDQLPPKDKTRLMYDEAVQALLAAGYRRTTRHNFVKPAFEYRYERMIAELRPLIGLGANSISYAKDCIYRNHSDLSVYESSVRESRLPVRSGHLFESVEQPHNYAVRQIEYLYLSGQDFERSFGTPLESALNSEIDILQEFGLARMMGKDLILTEDGIYYTSAVKRVFFHQSAWNRLQEMSNEDFQIERGTFASTTAPLQPSVAVEKLS